MDNLATSCARDQIITVLVKSLIIRASLHPYPKNYYFSFTELNVSVESLCHSAVTETSCLF